MRPEIIDALQAKIKKGIPVALATIVDTKGSSPGKVGFKMLVEANGAVSGTIGGGLIEAKVTREAVAAIAAGEPRLVSYTLDAETAGGLGMICGGETTVFIDVIAPPDTLVIVGAGHIAQPLAAMAKTAGYLVVVLDDRAEFCNAERFPEADQRQVGELGSLLDALELGRHSYVVIVSRGHKGDQLALEKTLRQDTAYLGMIGSKQKIETVFTNLRGKKFSEAELKKVYAPIGLSIGAKTPAEIAVCILAEMIAVKNNCRAHAGHHREAP
ncbi:MAG: XdhC/CoxI family protein [Bacillota bacterium]